MSLYTSSRNYFFAGLAQLANEEICDISKVYFVFKSSYLIKGNTNVKSRIYKILFVLETIVQIRSLTKLLAAY